MAEVSFNSPSPYQQQMSALERRQRMAEALQQQSYMPIERHSYNGIEAPISPAAGLAKMLEGFAPAMEQREIENKRGELVEGARKKGADWLTDLSQSEVPMPAGEQGPPRPKTEPEKMAHLLRGLYLDDRVAAGVAQAGYAKANASPEFTTVRRGETIGNVKNNQFIPIEGFKPNPEPNDAVAKVMADLKAGLIDQSMADARIAKLNSVPQAPQVHVGVGENAEAKKVGEYFGGKFSDIQDAAFAANDRNASLDRLEQLLDKVYTGAGGDVIQSLKKAAQAAGYNMEGVGDAEAAAALTNEIALQLRNPAGGAGMPGALSNSDREFLLRMLPGLGTTPEGRKLIFETYRKVNQRTIEIAKLARDYRKKNGRMDEGFLDELQDYSDKNPLFKGQPPAANTAPTAGAPTPEDLEFTAKKHNMTVPQVQDWLARNRGDR